MEIDVLEKQRLVSLEELSKASWRLDSLRVIVTNKGIIWHLLNTIPPLEPYLDIIYQDNHICVVNKPNGLLSSSLAINQNTMTVQ